MDKEYEKNRVKIHFLFLSHELNLENDFTMEPKKPVHKASFNRNERMNFNRNKKRKTPSPVEDSYGRSKVCRHIYCMNFLPKTDKFQPFYLEEGSP